MVEFLTELAEKTAQTGRTEQVKPKKPEMGKLSNVPELPAHFLPRHGYLDTIKEALLDGVSRIAGITGETLLGKAQDRRVRHGGHRQVGAGCGPGQGR